MVHGGCWVLAAAIGTITVLLPHRALACPPSSIAPSGRIPANAPALAFLDNGPGDPTLGLVTGRMPQPIPFVARRDERVANGWLAVVSAPLSAGGLYTFTADDHCSLPMAYSMEVGVIGPAPFPDAAGTLRVLNDGFRDSPDPPARYAFSTVLLDTDPTFEPWVFIAGFDVWSDGVKQRFRYYGEKGEIPANGLFEEFTAWCGGMTLEDALPEGPHHIVVQPYIAGSSKTIRPMAVDIVLKCQVTPGGGGCTAAARDDRECSGALVATALVVAAALGLRLKRRLTS